MVLKAAMGLPSCTGRGPGFVLLKREDDLAFVFPLKRGETLAVSLECVGMSMIGS